MRDCDPWLLLATSILTAWVGCSVAVQTAAAVVIGAPQALVNSPILHIVSTFKPFFDACRSCEGLISPVALRWTPLAWVWRWGAQALNEGSKLKYQYILLSRKLLDKTGLGWMYRAIPEHLVGLQVIGANSPFQVIGNVLDNEAGICQTAERACTLTPAAPSLAFIGRLAWRSTIATFRRPQTLPHNLVQLENSALVRKLRPC
jgi:hypothetical protein